MNAADRFDLHVHSRHSPDSSASLEALVAAAVASGLRGFALTDHNTVAGHRALAELQRRHPTSLFVPGVEVSTHEGHLLALGVAEAPPARRPVLETIAWVRAHGGEPILAHPLRRTHGVGESVARSAPGVALEVRNGHNGKIANARAERITAQLGRGGTGGSDAHAAREVGRAVTEISVSVATVDDLLEAIRRGRTRAEGRSLGPGGQARSSLRSAWLRIGRGFRSV